MLFYVLNMAISQLRSKRKVSGGRYLAARKKKQRELGNLPALTKLADRVKRMRRSMSGRRKERLLSENICNLYDPHSKKSSKVKILTVSENAANRHFVRRNIMTKGTIIETEKGKAKITSRPGQEGAINAILIGK